ncbi:MAG: 4Fe-4S binding protein [Thermotogaceae bacterium]|nr:4Fe-4S binding protein [Thermotogaceae bacterium]
MDLSTVLSGVELSNPVMPASGPLVGDDEKILYIERLGVGAIVTKTISTVAAQVPRPCIGAGTNYAMNAELWSELPPEKWINEILPRLKKELKVPLFVSVGYTKEDMEELVPKLDEFADAFEVSTHYVGKNLNVIGEIVATIRKHTKKPIYMKLSPHIPDPVGFAKVAKENGANGIVAVNSLGPTMKIDPAKRQIVFGGKDKFVWVSGPYLKPLALARVYQVAREVDGIEVIGVGGIKTADDVVEFLLAGAKAIQLLSSALIMGKDIYKRIVEGLPAALNKYGFSSVREVIETDLSFNLKYEPDHPKIDLDKCTFCKVCEMVCPYWAIWVYPDEKKVVVDEDKCFGCGLCQTRCPVNAISGVMPMEGKWR